MESMESLPCGDLHGGAGWLLTRGKLQIQTIASLPKEGSGEGHRGQAPGEPRSQIYQINPWGEVPHGFKRPIGGRSTPPSTPDLAH